MRSKAGTVVFAFVIALFPVAASFAGPLEDAEAAYKKGHFATVYRLFLIMARADDAAASRFLGDMYIEGHGVSQDYAEAVKWYRRAAELGDAPAERSLGVMYRDGTGVTKSYSEAAKWERRAADQGAATTIEGRVLHDVDLGASFGGSGAFCVLTSESCVSIPISSPSLTSVSTLSPRASFNDVELRAFCAFLPAVDPRANSPS